jgi:5-methylcytosine-specific restriction endonuclease McrA
MAAPRMTQIDHIIEVRDGGGFWDPANLRVVCKPHHDSKTLDVAAQRGEPISPNA